MKSVKWNWAVGGCCSLFALLFGFAGAATLPEGYVELEYVRCTGAQYVDVGMKLKSAYRVEEIFAYAKDAECKKVLIFGARSTHSKDNFEAITADKGELVLDFNNSSYTTTRFSYSGFSAGTKYYIRSGSDLREVRLGSSSGEVLASDNTAIADTIETPANCYLMSCYCTLSYAKMSGRVYSFRITDTVANKVLRDFVPCCRASDGAVGFYDIADHSDDSSCQPFYSSATDTALLPGPVAVANSVYLTVTDSSSKDATSGNTHSAWTNATQWSSKAAPESGKSYYVKRTDDGGAMALRSPYANKYDGTVYKFAGDALYVDYGCSLALPTHLVEFEKLVMYPGSILISPATSSEPTTPNLVLSGDIQIPGLWADSQPVVMRVHCSRALRIDGTISGSGTLKITGQTGTGAPKGYYYFSANNAGFTGRMIVSENAGNETPDYVKTNQVLYVHAESNLGGSRPSFDAQALTLERCGTLQTYQVNDTLELTTNYNRGVYVNGKGRITTSPTNSYANALKLSTRLTLNGELTKAGNGVLTLAAAGECTGDSSVDLVGGSLVLANARALNGADLKIGDGTSVAIVLDVADEYCRQYGCRLGTIAWPDGVSAPPISISATEVPAALKETKLLLGILTAPTATVEALKDVLVIPERLQRGCACIRKNVRDNGDGTATLYAEYGPKGFVIMFR